MKMKINNEQLSSIDTLEVLRDFDVRRKCP